MITLAAASTLRGLSGTTTAITCSVFGDEIAAGADAFKKLFQGQLATSVATLYTVPGSTQALIKTIILDNTTGSAATATLYVDGTAAANRIVSVSIPAGGSAVWAGDGWKTLDANGAQLTTASGSSSVTLTGDVTGTGTGTVATTIAADAVTNTQLANMAQATIKGRAAAAGTGDPTDLTGTQVGDIVGPAWSTFTPTLTQSGTVTKTVTSARYIQVGKFVFFQLDLSVTGTGSAANTVLVGLPVTAATSANTMVGNMEMFDSSAGQDYSAMARLASSTTMSGLDTRANGAIGASGSFTAALASGDVIRINGFYEAA